MHIVEKHYLGLELKNPSRAHVLREAAVFAANAHSEVVGDSDLVSKAAAFMHFQVSLLNPYTKNYLFTETAQEVINNIKVNELFDIEILRTLPTGKTRFYNFLYGKDRFIHCVWNNDELHIIELARYADNPAMKRSVALASLKSCPKVFSDTLADAIKCLIFLKLTDPEIIHLAAGEKYGTRKQGHYNATPLPVIIVDSTWNQYIVRTEGFGVSGHFRMQRCGKGNADLKLTWIKPYQKHGYVRLPKSEPILEETE